MAGHNLMEEKFEEIKVFGSPALLSGQRFDHGSVPEGLYIYEVRHSASRWDEPVQVAKCVVNNFMGTLVTRTPFVLQEDGCLGTVSADWDFEYGTNLTVMGFMDRYPPEPYSHKVKENYIGITKPETLMVWASFARPGLEISEEQAGLVLNFMEHQGYTLSVSGRQMARTDITDGKTIPYSLDDVISNVYEWNYEMVHGRADGIAGLENDCLLLGGLFAQTVYGKECLALAESIVPCRKSFKQEKNIIPGTGPAGTALNNETYFTPVKKQGRAR